MTRDHANCQESKVQTFTSHFMSELLDNGVGCVQKWLHSRKIDLFSKDLIMLPINEDGHWSFSAIMNPGNMNDDSTEQQPL